MDEIAQWMGLTKSIYYTNKIAYFERDGEDLMFVCHVRDFDPAHNLDQFLPVLDKLMDEGGKITIEMQPEKNSKYINKVAVLEIDGQIYTSRGMKIQVAIIHTIYSYVSNLIYNRKLQTTK